MTQLGYEAAKFSAFTNMIVGLAWPFAALIIVYILRKPISSAITILAKRLEQVGGDSGAKFNNTWKEGIEQAGEVVRPETEQSEESANLDRSAHSQSELLFGLTAPAVRLAGSVPPREAINSAKSRFDHLLQWAVVRRNLIEPGSPHDLEKRISLLVEAGYLDQRKTAVLRAITKLYAASCRMTDSQLTLENALKFQQLVSIAEHYLTPIATSDRQ